MPALHASIFDFTRADEAAEQPDAAGQ